MSKRIVITGMAVNTPIGDTLEEFLQNLLRGQSAITRWKRVKTDHIYGKIGGDISEYDMEKKCESLQGKLPEEVLVRFRSLSKKVPWSMSISMLVAMDAALDADLFPWISPDNNIATIVAGHNLNQAYTFANHEQFNEEPDFIDALFAVYGLDTSHAGTVSEVLQLKGAAHTIGAACASGNAALRNACDEIRCHGAPTAVLVAPLLDFSSMDIQGMALIDAISYASFNDTPERASRPYDADREGFVPAHGAAALVLEELDHARARRGPISMLKFWAWNPPRTGAISPNLRKKDKPV